MDMPDAVALQAISPLQAVAEDIAARAKFLGADAAECMVSEGARFSVRVRLGEIEKLTDSGSKGVGVRVLRGKASGSAYSSDFSGAGLERMLRSAMEAAGVTAEDAFAGLPDEAELGAAGGDLGLFDPAVLELSSAEKIDLARRCEQAALDAEPAVTQSEGAFFSSGWGYWGLANSLGFSGGYRAASCSLGAAPVAEANGLKERGSWYEVGRTPEALGSAEEIGRRAAERAARRLHPRKMRTMEAPVVFEPGAAKSLLGHLAAAVSGSAVYRKSSFLAGRLGEAAAAPQVTVFDDALTPGGLGSSPFDDEGARGRRTTVIAEGRLESYLLNSYAARKLALRTTGNAARGLAGAAGIGQGNFEIVPGCASPEEIAASVEDGLFVTDLIGFGVNLVTGDYSRGTAGFRIEKGRLTHPVSEVAIGGNLADMLRGIEAVGNDPDRRGATVAPTLKIAKMTIAGQ